MLNLKTRLGITPIFALILITCCTNINKRQNLANKIALASNLKKHEIRAKDFTFLTFSKIKNNKLPLNIYIEGDGFAWKNKYTISKNPTPKNPISLRLAAIDTNPNILYIARPCQYVDLSKQKNCHPKYWAQSRFSTTVINNINMVINDFKQKHQIANINISGYSGGGALAVLIAAIRNDINSIKTIAANLNHKDLMKFHNVSPLSDSLDAIDFTSKVANIKQLHLIGQKDKIVPKHIILSYINKIKQQQPQNIKFKIIKNATHHYPKWPQEWSKINTKFHL